ncbi:hypothetical protein [Gilliamella sp. wkB112]|uniref:hypothetical protein n=1 Tax=Gilliamella sp. wkB112 TaxID=3120257 RepID=UPI0011466202|nr:hypothetical protein [Gilliamella apicola]
MNFNLLTIETSKQASIPVKVLPFRYMAYYIKEIYMALLPKININNSSKIEIIFGAKSEDDVEWDNMLGVTSIFVEDFDFKSFYSIPSSAQELTILNYIDIKLQEIVSRTSNQAHTIELIKETSKKVVETNFALKILIKKLSKGLFNRKYNINIYRILNREVGEGWLLEVIDKKESIIYKEWLEETPNYLDRRDYYGKALLQSNTYVIFNKLGQKTFSVDLSFLK